MRCLIHAFVATIACWDHVGAATTRCGGGALRPGGAETAGGRHPGSGGPVPTGTRRAAAVAARWRRARGGQLGRCGPDAACGGCFHACGVLCTCHCLLLIARKPGRLAMPPPFRQTGTSRPCRGPSRQPRPQVPPPALRAPPTASQQRRHQEQQQQPAAAHDLRPQRALPLRPAARQLRAAGSCRLGGGTCWSSTGSPQL